MKTSREVDFTMIVPVFSHGVSPPDRRRVICRGDDRAGNDGGTYVVWMNVEVPEAMGPSHWTVTPAAEPIMTESLGAQPETVVANSSSQRTARTAKGGKRSPTTVLPA